MIKNKKQNWDVSSVNDMSSMFDKCADINFSYLANWDVSNVVDMSRMFKGPFDIWGNPNASALGSWDLSSVTNFDNMFAIFTEDGSLTDYTYPTFTSRPGTWDNSVVTIDGE